MQENEAGIKYFSMKNGSKKTTSQFTNEDLLVMIRDKGKVCVSLIIPATGPLAERKVNEQQFSTMLSRAADTLRAENDPTLAESLIEKMNAQAAEIDFNLAKEGLGLFISENTRQLFYFNFPVLGKLFIGDRFELRDVIFCVQYNTPYYLLRLGQEQVSLFKGNLKLLKEVRDQNFPALLSEEFQYNFPTRNISVTGGSAVQGFKRDKSTMDEMRYDSFLQNVDHLLSEYFTEDTLLILCGLKHNTANFLNKTIHGDRLLSVVFGHYDQKTETELAEIVWPLVQSNLEREMQDAIDDWQEKEGEGLTEEGIVNVWRAVYEGRGEQLLVERDFSVNAYVSDKQPDKIHLAPPRKPHRLLTDAVNDLIDMMLEKNGLVTFVHNGMLNQQQHVALITEY